MFFHAGRGQIMLLSASNQTGHEELWSWNGMSWMPVPTSGPAPPARELSGAVYDTRRKRVVLYGGAAVRPRQGRLDDLWEWDGGKWLQIQANGPGPRDHHAMVYDEGRGRTVLFSGLENGDKPGSDTWEWDGTSWTKAATEGPGGGGGHFAIGYDSIRKKVVLFGGMNITGKSHSETWTWDGKTWTKLALDESASPSRRYRHRMTFDSHTGGMVLFGGLLPKRAPAETGDTWIFDGVRWTEVKAAGPTPEARNSQVMAYDPARRKVVLYGGASFDGKKGTIYQDTWEWDGQKWQRVD